jgi:hypothetical protein
MQGVQLMMCVIYLFFKSFICSQISTESKKGFITYDLEHGIMAMKKHVANEYNLNLQK